ncbi:SMC-Scp complex subunit ScpB [Candidatus Parcubacteria bacterium]|nr:SMC-Scp complex subunit ScpB [Candidatus Parcubacteria bacterium]
MKLSLTSQIEAVLFFETDALSVKKLAALLNQKPADIETALGELEAQLEGRGISLSRLGDEVMLVTASEMAPLVEKLSKEALEGELSKASVETLSVILYRGGATKSEIDYIRGVNSAFILRALQIRGLVERKTNPKDSRSFFYTPTFDLYNHLGVTKQEELPDYAALRAELDTLAAASEVKPAEPKENE